MVAPSLVMVTSCHDTVTSAKCRFEFLSWQYQITEHKLISFGLSATRTPMSSTNILSRPTGPRELLTMFAMDAAAMTAKSKMKVAACEFQVIRRFYWQTVVFASGTKKTTTLKCFVILFGAVHNMLTTPSDRDSVILSH